MKKTLIILLLLIGSISPSFSQNSNIFKFRTTDLAMKFKETNGFGEWSEWEKVNVLAVIDADKARIKIFSKETQVYDIATEEGKSINDDGDEILSWYCVNEDGSQCRVQLWKRFYEDGNFYNQLYVNFSDVRIVYNLNLID